eukprot:GILK01015507.1.p1 GENE.GILK01015507.1~~GILK01015507.1.p1  ORF type:complete len:314 (-),score=11.88 GILK01015507.1:308-1249(-)
MATQMTAYLAAEGFVTQLAAELRSVAAQYDRLIVAEGAPQCAHWNQNIWLNPKWISFESIGDAAKKLKDIQRNWSLYPYAERGRSKLILEQLPRVSAKPLQFPCKLPSAPLGSFTLLDRHTMLAASDCTSSVPNGEYHFVEDTIGPPSRAYLKLWEIFSRIQEHPVRGQSCLELGASPGSWTYVLQSLGTTITCVDRAPLDPKIAALSGVKYMQQNGLSLTPSRLSERFDWVLSDAICYPDKLFPWVNQWSEVQPPVNIVCSIKFQGSDHYELIKQFAAIPHSKLMHLFHNKHELTWVRLASWTDPSCLSTLR